jgi:hypothetical protein
MRTRILLGSAVSILSAGCSSTGPKSVTVDGGAVVGMWSFNASLSGGGVSCSETNGVMNLVQSGSTFSGTYMNVLINCVGNGKSFSGGPYGGSVVNGTVNGSTVSFEFDAPGITQTGTISGNTMSGTSVQALNLGSIGNDTLSGPWTSAR